MQKNRIPISIDDFSHCKRKLYFSILIGNDTRKRLEVVSSRQQPEMVEMHVLAFMGRKPDPRFQGEAVPNYKKRPIGCKVKFKLKSNSIKIY